MQDAASTSARLLQQAHHKGDVVAASSYGSLYNGNGQFNRTSDIDWLIVFESLERMLDSTEYTQMQRILQVAHIPFGSPALSLENVKCGNHLIGPLLHGVKQSVFRVVIGDDPIELFRSHGIKKNSREILSRMFGSYPRYFYEGIPANLQDARDDDEVLTSLLQRSVDYFIDTYRSMIVMNAHEEDYSVPLDFATYEGLYEGTIPPSAMECGKRIHSFIRKYKALIQETMLKVEQGGEADRQEEASMYASALFGYLSAVKDAVLFCQANIECFRHTFPLCSR